MTRRWAKLASWHIVRPDGKSYCGRELTGETYDDYARSEATCESCWKREAAQQPPKAADDLPNT